MRNKETDVKGKNVVPQSRLGQFLADKSLVLLAFIMLVAFVLMAALRPGIFLTAANFRAMAFQFPEIGLLAIAVMIAMLLGGIDLSVVGVANLSTIVAAYAMIALEPVVGAWSSSALGVLVALAVGLACGALNGFLIAKIGIPAILATLGTMEIFTGISVFITGGPAVFGLPEPFGLIGSGIVGGVIPVPAIIFFVIVAIGTIVLQRKKFGLELYLMGTSRKAARFTGIKTDSTIIKAHMMASLFAACGGIIMSSRAVSAKSDYGLSYTIMAILVAVLGGVNPFGGFGKVTGVVMAILTVQFLSTGLNIMRVDGYFRVFVWGSLLVIMLLLNYFVNKYSEKKQIKALHAPKKDETETA